MFFNSANFGLTGLVISVLALSHGVDASAEATRIFAYPNAGQSQQQQEQDFSECHQWSVSQTGFDPTKPLAGPASSSAYGPGAGNRVPTTQMPPNAGNVLGIGGGLLGDAVKGAALGAAGEALMGDAGKGAAVGALATSALGAFTRASQPAPVAPQAAYPTSTIASDVQPSQPTGAGNVLGIGGGLLGDAAKGAALGAAGGALMGDAGKGAAVGALATSALGAYTRASQPAPVAPQAAYPTSTIASDVQPSQPAGAGNVLGIGGGLLGDAAKGAALGAAGGALMGDAGKGAAVGALASSAMGVYARANQPAASPAQMASSPQQQPAFQNLEQGRSDYNGAFGACMKAHNYTVN